MIITADWHICPRFKDDVIKSLDWFNETTSGTVIHCGDFFDSPILGDRSLTSGEILRILGEHIDWDKYEWYIIPGNHDIGRVGQKSALQVLKAFPNVNIIEETTDLTIDGNKFRFIPWHCKEPEPEPDMTLIAHTDNIEYASKYDTARLGHMHTRDKYYVGSLFQGNWAGAIHSGYEIDGVFHENPVATKFVHFHVHDIKEADMSSDNTKYWVTTEIPPDYEDYPGVRIDVKRQVADTPPQDDIESYDILDLYNWYKQGNINETKKRILQECL